MKSEPYAAIVFDFDGTLFNLPVDWNEARKDLSVILGIPMGGVSIFDKLREVLSSRPGLKEILFRSLDVREGEAAEVAEPIDGAVDLISWASRVSRLGLVTMQGRASCIRVLDRFGVAQYFGVVLTREDSLERTQQLLSACGSLGARPTDMLFVADKMSDLAAGRKTGATVALVGKMARAEWGPDHLFKDVGGLRALL
jgi:phosphoglycolate phosphatase-like HAD superfamily hydrolase